jgi:hypothetical protein
MVYLAGPIAADPDGAAHWRANATEHLVGESEVVVFNPRTAFSVPEKHLLNTRFTDALQVVNDVAIASSSAVLVHVARDIISGGTEHEMSLCAELGQHIVMWVPWLPSQEAYSTREKHCHYIDAPYAKYGSELRVVYVSRNLQVACAEAARHALVIGS